MISPNKEQFDSVRDHLNRADLSTSEQFDKAILTLSTGGLGFSIALIKFVVPLQSATHTFLLRLSWAAFSLAIILTVISFLTARSAIRDTRMYAFKYYLEELDEFGNKVSIYSRITYWLNMVSGLIFVIAVVLTVIFVSLNTALEPKMQDETNITEPTEKKGYVPPPANSGGKPSQGESTKPSESEPKKGTDES